MHMLTEDRNRQSDERLSMKTQDTTLIHEAMIGAGLSHWEAKYLPELVQEIYFSQGDEQPLRDGQILFQCTAINEGAGKCLAACQQVQVRLTTHDQDVDRPLHRREGLTAMRRQILCRITEEARSQGGLLTQEDAAYLRQSSERTIRRDVAALLKLGIHVATRGVLKDIGPSVSHKGIAIRHWLEGKEPADVARAINHSVQAVDRYLNDFRRVVYTARQGFDAVTTARMTRLSPRLIETYRTIFTEASENPAYAYRWQEIELQLSEEMPAQQQEETPVTKGAKTISRSQRAANPTRNSEAKA